MSKYSLMTNFETLDELTEFITIYKKINQNTENKVLKTTSDKRGSKTVGLNQRAKQFRFSHPEISYRDCLVEVSKQEISLTLSLAACALFPPINPQPIIPKPIFKDHPNESFYLYQ